MKIGILDSGLGGLSVFNEVRKLMPTESVVYFGDSAWCPYGVRKPAEIQQRVFTITDLLLEKGCKIIIIACNSATISAVEAARATYPVPFVGMEPGVKPAASLTKSGTIGILATEASLAGEKFHQLLSTHGKGIRTITRPCPSFVELVEHGNLQGPEAIAEVKKETLPLLEAGADVLVLGCTHYPFLRPLIQEVAGENVQIIDTGAAVARHTQSLMEHPSVSDTKPEYEFITTGDLARLQELFPTLCPDTPSELIRFSQSSI